MGRLERDESMSGLKGEALAEYAVDSEDGRAEFDGDLRIIKRGIARDDRDRRTSRGGGLCYVRQQKRDTAKSTT